MKTQATRKGRSNSSSARDEEDPLMGSIMGQLDATRPSDNFQGHWYTGVNIKRVLCCIYTALGIFMIFKGATLGGTNDVDQDTTFNNSTYPLYSFSFNNSYSTSNSTDNVSLNIVGGVNLFYCDGVAYIWAAFANLAYSFYKHSTLSLPANDWSSWGRWIENSITYYSITIITLLLCSFCDIHTIILASIPILALMASGETFHMTTKKIHLSMIFQPIIATLSTLILLFLLWINHSQHGNKSSFVLGYLLLYTSLIIIENIGLWYQVKLDTDTRYICTGILSLLLLGHRIGLTICLYKGLS